MTKLQRELVANDLLTVRGWLSCWFPMGATHGRALGRGHEKQVVVRAGNLKASIKIIDNILKHALKHKANGICKD